MSNFIFLREASEAEELVSRHNVDVRPVDVMFSDFDCILEDLESDPAVRVGMRLVSGLREASAQRIVEERARAPFDSAEELARPGRLEQHEMTQLASAGALATLSGHWRVQV